MAKNWEFFLKEIPKTKRLQKKSMNWKRSVGRSVDCSEGGWGEVAPVPVGCDGRKGYGRRKRGKGGGGGGKNPRTQNTRKTNKKYMLVRAGQMESLVGFGIIFLFSYIFFPLLLEYCSVIWFLRMGQGRIG